MPPSPADRLQLRANLKPRLEKLGNRLDDKTREAILGAIHARIPMLVGVDVQAASDAVRSASREANAALFASLRDKHRSLAEVHRQATEKEAASAEAVNGLEDATRRLRQGSRTAAQSTRKGRTLIFSVYIIADELIAFAYGSPTGLAETAHGRGQARADHNAH